MGSSINLAHYETILSVLPKEPLLVSVKSILAVWRDEQVASWAIDYVGCEV